MVFPFLVVLTIIFLALVKNVNSKLNNPDDTSFGSETSGSQSEENKDDDFPPVDEVFQNNKEPERESEPVFTQTQEPEPEPEPQPEPKPEPEPVVPLKTYDSLYGLIGKPLAHSTSMVRFNKFFRDQHINAHYNNYELESIEDVTKLIEKYPNLRGFNVTIPYKQDIIPYLTRLDETAQSIGAVNTVKVLHRDGGGCSASTCSLSGCGFRPGRLQRVNVRRASLSPSFAFFFTAVTLGVILYFPGLSPVSGTG